MAQAVSRRPLSANSRVRSHDSPCEIYGGRSGTGPGSSQYFGCASSVSFPQCTCTPSVSFPQCSCTPSVSLPQCTLLSLIYSPVLTKRPNRGRPATFEKSKTVWIEKYFHLVLKGTNCGPRQRLFPLFHSIPFNYFPFIHLKVQLKDVEIVIM